MSGKAKFTLVLLAFMAPVSVSYFLSALRPLPSKPLTASAAQQIGTFSLLDDADGDGLSNRDENLWRTDWRDPDSDGDGFKDGEEVLSGHDPAKAGPNDFVDRSKNLTDRYASLLLGGVFAGDISAENPNTLEAFETVTEKVFEEYQKFASAPRNIKLKTVPDGPENLGNYLDAIQAHLKETFPDSIRNIEEYLRLYGSADSERTKELVGDEKKRRAMVTEAERIALELQELSDALADIPVPETLARPHRNGIILLESMAEQVVIASGLAEDPIKAGLATTALSSLVNRTSVGFIYDYAATIRLAVQKFGPQPPPTDNP